VLDEATLGDSVLEAKIGLSLKIRWLMRPEVVSGMRGWRLKTDYRRFHVSAYRCLQNSVENLGISVFKNHRINGCSSS
jgi:hypothetical protein